MPPVCMGTVQRTQHRFLLQGAYNMIFNKGKNYRWTGRGTGKDTRRKYEASQSRSLNDS